MTCVRVHNSTISLDGYGVGPRQTREEPLGVGGEALHDWFLPTRAFQRIIGKTGGTTAVAHGSVAHVRAIRSHAGSPRGRSPASPAAPPPNVAFASPSS